jgi:hypothetical protein
LASTHPADPAPTMMKSYRPSSRSGRDPEVVALYFQGMITIGKGDDTASGDVPARIDH